MASAGPSKRPRTHRTKKTAGLGTAEPDELKTIREGLTKENFPWLRKFDNDIKKSPRPVDKGVHLSLYSNMLVEEWHTNNRPVVPLKLLSLSDLSETHMDQIVSLLDFQGWTSLWSRLDMRSFSREYTRMFYANLWITPQTESQSFLLNTVVDGTSLSFSIPEICEILRIRNEGLSDFSVFDWSSKYGIPEQDVKFDLGFFPSRKTQNMALIDRILLAIVTYCVNGKSTRNPSNMDFYVTYRIKNQTQLNFAWIMVEVMFSALRKASKALPFANLITVLLKSKGIVIPDSELTPVANTDYYSNYNIVQAIDSQKRKATNIPGLDDEAEAEPQANVESSTIDQLRTQIQSLEQSVQHLQLSNARHEYRFGVLKDVILQQMPWASFPSDFDDLGGDTAANTAAAGDTRTSAGGAGGSGAGGSGQQMSGFAGYASSPFNFGDLQHPGGSGAGSGGGV